MTDFCERQMTTTSQARTAADMETLYQNRLNRYVTAMQNGKLVNSGGRVLGVTALGETIAAAQKRAYEAVAKINWQGCFFRRDIASKAIR